VADLKIILHQTSRKSSSPLWLRWRNQGWNKNRIKSELGHLTSAEIKRLRKMAKQECRDNGVPLRGKPKGDGITTAINDGTDRIESSQSGSVWTINGMGRISTLEQLLERAEVDTNKWRVESWRANAYEAQRAGGGVVQLWQVKASLRENPAWLWSPVQPRAEYKKVIIEKPEVTLVLPDSQNGYLWNSNMSTLDPLHDRRCWDIAVQVAEMINPDRIVLLGDMVDFAEGSKRWPITNNLRATTQPTIEELYWWLHRLRDKCPKSHIKYLEGNHEDRIDRALVGSVSELSDLRPAGDPEPLVTWRRLLALDSLGVDYVGPYGTNITLAPDCEAHHGTVVAQGGGATAARILKGAHISQIYGHIHRREYGCKTVYGPSGRRTIFAASPGTFSRVDGVVPAVKKRIDWQQGIAILVNDGNRTSCQVIPIDEGIAYIYGKRIVGKDPGPDIARDTGWPQLA